MFGCIGWICVAIALGAFVVYALTTLSGLVYTSIAYGAAGLILLVISSAIDRRRKGISDANRDKRAHAAKPEKHRKQRRRVRVRRENPLLHQMPPPPRPPGT